MAYPTARASKAHRPTTTPPPREVKATELAVLARPKGATGRQGALPALLLLAAQFPQDPVARRMIAKARREAPRGLGWFKGV